MPISDQSNQNKGINKNNCLHFNVKLSHFFASDFKSTYNPAQSKDLEAYAKIYNIFRKFKKNSK